MYKQTGRLYKTSKTLLSSARFLNSGGTSETGGGGGAVPDITKRSYKTYKPPANSEESEEHDRLYRQIKQKSGDDHLDRLSEAVGRTEHNTRFGADAGHEEAELNAINAVYNEEERQGIRNKAETKTMKTREAAEWKQRSMKDKGT